MARSLDLRASSGIVHNVSCPGFSLFYPYMKGVDRPYSPSSNGCADDAVRLGGR